MIAHTLLVQEMAEHSLPFCEQRHKKDMITATSSCTVHACILLTTTVIHEQIIMVITLCAYAQQGYAFGRVGLCKYVRIRVYTYVCVYIYKYIYTYVRTYMYIYLSTKKQAV